MAAGWLTHLAADAVDVRSAGSIPAGQTLDIIREVRDDIRGRVEKLLHELGVQPNPN